MRAGAALVAGVLLAGCARLTQASPGDGPQLVTAPATLPATTTTTSTTTLPPTTTTTSTTSTTTLPPTTTTTTTVPATAAATLPADVDPVAPPAAGVTEPLVAVGRIEIPAIGVDRTMYEGITLATLDQGPGHWPGTAQPGQVGNAVIAGHRVSHNRDFRNVDQLKPGDQIVLTTAAGRYVYQVSGTQIVKPDAIWIVDQTPTATATLFACHPPGSTKERIVVFADLVA